MNTNEILKKFISKFDFEDLILFFRSKIGTVKTTEEEVEPYLQELKDTFTNGKQLCTITTTNHEDIAVYCFKVNSPLSERSGKKAQYDLAKSILKAEGRYSAGIFVFYDDKGDFRFSLVYDILSTEGKRSWSNFRRFTYFVSKEQTNKTFIRQMTEADFSALEKIKDAFSVEPVTKQFYSEIQNWYFWAMDKIQFPDDYKYSNDPAKDNEIRNATNLIRLITRIIYMVPKREEINPSRFILKGKTKRNSKGFSVWRQKLQLL